jgi:hypothetical protein
MTSSFSICIPFISFSCLITLVKNSRNILSKNCHNGHPCLSLDFRGKYFSFPSFTMELAMGFPYVVFIILRYESFILSFFRDLLWEDVGFCQRIFLHLLRWLCDPSLFLCLYAILSLSTFAYISLSLHSWN